MKTIEIDFNLIGEINSDFTEMKVHFSQDGWDSHKLWRLDLTAAAVNCNDLINEPIFEALEREGYTLSNEDHVFDEDREIIIYKLVKLSIDSL